LRVFLLAGNCCTFPEFYRFFDPLHGDFYHV